jgi:predicted amidohydrolase
MSVAGYQRENADELSFSENDSRLKELRKLAADLDIIVIVGAPVSIKSKLYIGSFILFPNNTISIYTKQFLHDGEEIFFQSSFDYNPIIKLGNERISSAICADINNPIHVDNANEAGATIYIASLFFLISGISGGHELLRNYAKEYSMNVLMSNFSGKSWGLDAGGKSAFWDSNGKLIIEMDITSTGLLIVEKETDGWRGKELKD